VFALLNAFAAYAHHHNEIFHRFYPFPFALDVGRGPSMLPTIGCGLGDDDDDDGVNLYLRDCWSHHFVWFDLDHLGDYFARCRIRPRRVGGGGGRADEEDDGDATSPAPSSSSSLSRPWRRGDVVTHYNRLMNSTVTKRIVGVGGEAVRAYGEYSSEYAASAGDGGGSVGAVDDRPGNDRQAKARRAGVSRDPQFLIPFCQSVSSSSAKGRDGARLDRRGGGDDIGRRVVRGAPESCLAVGRQPPPFHRQPPLRPGAGIIAARARRPAPVARRARGLPPRWRVTPPAPTK
jgi:hypothetical protein